MIEAFSMVALLGLIGIGMLALGLLIATVAATVVLMALDIMEERR